jgi:hypothetical protein
MAVININKYSFTEALTFFNIVTCSIIYNKACQSFYKYIYFMLNMLFIVPKKMSAFAAFKVNANLGCASTNRNETHD